LYVKLIFCGAIACCGTIAFLGVIAFRDARAFAMRLLSPTAGEARKPTINIFQVSPRHPNPPTPLGFSEQIRIRFRSLWLFGFSIRNEFS
jgi:hypothetical protein